jgi:hypothetical protein
MPSFSIKKKRTHAIKQSTIANTARPTRGEEREENGQGCRASSSLGISQSRGEDEEVLRREKLHRALLGWGWSPGGVPAELSVSLSPFHHPPATTTSGGQGENLRPPFPSPVGWRGTSWPRSARSTRTRTRRRQLARRRIQVCSPASFRRLPRSVS